MANRDPAPGRLELVQRFVNTHDFEDGSEVFATPQALREWLADHDLLDRAEPVSASDLSRAVEVREALRSLCLANNGEPLDPTAIETLNSASRVAPMLVRFGEDGESRLAPAGGGVPAALASILSAVAESMSDGTWDRLKACPASDCLWAFYDHSRNRSGHWCTMSVCGNRAKARSYRDRHRHGEQSHGEHA